LSLLRMLWLLHSFSVFLLMWLFAFAKSSSFLLAGLLALVIALTSFFLFKKIQIFVDVPSKFDWRWSIILIVAAIPLSGTMQSSRMGEDRGSYLAMGHEMYANKSLNFKLREREHPSQEFAELAKISQSHPSFRQTSENTFTIDFYPLYPSIIAASLFVDKQLYQWINPLLLLMGLFCFGILVQHLTKSFFVASIGLLLLATNSIMVATSTNYFSEPLGFLLSFPLFALHFLLAPKLKEYFWRSLYLFTPIYLALFLSRMHFIHALLAGVILVVAHALRFRSLSKKDFLYYLLPIGFSIFLAGLYYFFYQPLFYTEFIVNFFFKQFVDRPILQVGLVCVFLFFVYLAKNLNAQFWPTANQWLSIGRKLVLGSLIFNIVSVLFFKNSTYEGELMRPIDEEMPLVKFIQEIFTPEIAKEIFTRIFHVVDSLSMTLIGSVGILLLVALWPMRLASTENSEGEEKTRQGLALVLICLAFAITLWTFNSPLIPSKFWYSRYLFIEMIPLVVLAAAIRCHKFSLNKTIMGFLFFGSLAIQSSALQALVRAPEGESSQALLKMNEITNGRPLIFTAPQALPQHWMAFAYRYLSRNHVIIAPRVAVEELDRIQKSFAVLGLPPPLIESDRCSNHASSIVIESSVQEVVKSRSVWTGWLPPDSNKSHVYKFYLCDIDIYINEQQKLNMIARDDVEKFSDKDTLSVDEWIPIWKPQPGLKIVGALHPIERNADFVWTAAPDIEIEFNLAEPCRNGRIHIELATFPRYKEQGLLFLNAKLSQKEFSIPISKQRIKPFLAGEFLPGKNTLKLSFPYCGKPKDELSSSPDERVLCLSLSSLRFQCMNK